MLNATVGSTGSESPWQLAEAGFTAVPLPYTWMRSSPACRLMASMPESSCFRRLRACTLHFSRFPSAKARAACSPAIECAFCVPASRCSGISCGMVSRNVRMPDPPAIRGLSLMPRRTMIAPVPCGPISALCPEKHRISIPDCLIRIGMMPIVCAASRIKVARLSLHSADTTERSMTLPVTLLPCESATAIRVSGFCVRMVLRVCSRSSISRRASALSPTKWTTTPLSLSL